jgi:hypothetical protein
MISEDELHIEDGENLTKNELKSRLHQMEIEYDNTNQRKNYFVDLYNKALKYSTKRKKIEERLKKDTIEFNERRKKRTRDTSEDASQILNLKGRASKLDKKETVNKDNKIQTDINVKTGPSKNFFLEKKDIPNEDKQKNFVMEEEKNTSHRNTINFSDFIPKRETISTAANLENLSKVRKSEAKDTIENNSFVTRKIQLTSGKVMVKKISGELFSPGARRELEKPLPVENKIVQNVFKPTTIAEEVSNLSNLSSDKDKRFSFTDKNEIISDYNINNEQIYFTKSEDVTERPISFPNKRRTSYAIGVSNKDQGIQQNTINVLENFSKSSAPKESSKKSVQPAIQELEEVHRVKYTIPSHKNLIPQQPSIQNEINQNINGASIASQREIPKITVSSIKTIPVLKANNGMNVQSSWKDVGPSGTSLRQLIKYFITGVACSVIFSGIYYLIKFAPSINLGISSPKIEYINTCDVPDKSTYTQTSKEFNFGVGENPKVIDLEKEVGPGFFKTFNDRLYEFFRPISRVYEFIIDPKKVFYELVIEGLKYVAVNLVWEWIKKHIWMFVLIFVFKLIAIKTYHYVNNRRNASKIFNSVKTRLKNIYDVNNFQNGISEEEIIREYSKEYNIKEENFKSNILPRLKNFRKQDGEVKEFESYVNGRIRTVWQYLGY